MSILGINSNNYELTLGDTLEYVDLIVSGHSSRGSSFEDHQRAIDYIDCKKDLLREAIKALPPGIPKGPTLRRIIWDVLGIWLSVRTDGKLIFQKGSKLAKYYKIYEPGDMVPTGGSWNSNFEIKSDDGLIYTHVSISLKYKQVAPHDGYKF